jgi:protein-disulfide isomerase
VVKQQKQAASMRPFYYALGAIAGVATVLLVWLARREPEGAAPREVAAAAPTGTAEGYLYGNPNAPVTIVEFADFECPACARYATVTGPDVRTRLADSGLVNIRFYDFPLPQHRFSLPASMAAACANEQGKFWEMHDRLFEGQAEWSPQFASVRNPKGIFQGYARDLGLEVGRWEECYDADRHRGRIQANAAYGQQLGVNQTPTFQIGRRLHPGLLTYDEIKREVQGAIAARGTGAPRDSAAAGASGGVADSAAGGASPR